MSPKLFIGGFSAESAWRPTSTATINPVARFDEKPDCDWMYTILSLACSVRDRHAIVSDVPSAVAESIGNSELIWDPVYFGEGIDANEVVAQLSPETELVPFAITQRSCDFSRGLGLPCPSVSPQIVAAVNSKLWSSEARESVGLGVGKVAHSTKQLQAISRRYLRRGPIIVKDAYGVSGDGNYVIETPERLNALIRNLARQERVGLDVAVVVEPYFAKKFDFSGQFHIEPSQIVSFLGFRRIFNYGSRYVGSRRLQDTELSYVDTPAYLAALAPVTDRLAAAGYHGPICVDSLCCRDGSIVPVLEINARMSLGLLSINADEKLRTRGLFSTLVKLPLICGVEWSIDRAFALIQESRLAASPLSKSGFVLMAHGVDDIQHGRSREQIVVLLVYEHYDEEALLISRLHDIVRQTDAEIAIPFQAETQIRSSMRHKNSLATGVTH